MGAPPAMTVSQTVSDRKGGRRDEAGHGFVRTDGLRIWPGVVGFWRRGACLCVRLNDRSGPSPCQGRCGLGRALEFLDVGEAPRGFARPEELAVGAHIEDSAG